MFTPPGYRSKFPFKTNIVFSLNFIINKTLNSARSCRHCRCYCVAVIKGTDSFKTVCSSVGSPINRHYGLHTVFVTVTGVCLASLYNTMLIDPGFFQGLRTNTIFSNTR